MFKNKSMLLLTSIIISCVYLIFATFLHIYFVLYNILYVGSSNNTFSLFSNFFTFSLFNTLINELIFNRFTNFLLHASNLRVVSLVSLVGVFIILPHLIMLFVAILFNIFAFFIDIKPLTIATGVFYCISALLFPTRVLFLAPSITLVFLHVLRKPKYNKKNSNYPSDYNTQNSYVGNHDDIEIL
jgi:hypothetical protein